MKTCRLSFFATCFNNVLFLEAVFSLKADQPSSSRRSFLAESASAATLSTATGFFKDEAFAAIKAKSYSGFTSTTKLPKIGLGCWAWGDSLFWGYNPFRDDDLKEVFNYAVKNQAPVLFDTAELYGLGRSEYLIGEYAKNCSDGRLMCES